MLRVICAHESFLLCCPHVFNKMQAGILPLATTSTQAAGQLSAESCYICSCESSGRTTSICPSSGRVISSRSAM